MIRFRHGWRRFRPSSQPVRRESETDLFDRAEEELRSIAHTLNVPRLRRFDVSQLHDVVDDRRHMAELSGSALDWITVLVLQAPRAAIAQRSMDKHPHGFSGGQARLYELIDFNDSFVSAVLSVPDEYLPRFQKEAKRLMDKLCDYLRTPGFSDEQYEAITHGLSREIAVYRGAVQEGLSVEMTSRAQDAKGVDMVVSDPDSGKMVNVDVKTRSAYYYRLKDLRQEGRISAGVAEQAEIDGFCEVRNGHSVDGVDVVLMRIDAEEIGEIRDFSFVDTQRLGGVLRRILRVYGATIEAGKVSEYAR